MMDLGLQSSIGTWRRMLRPRLCFLIWQYGFVGNGRVYFSQLACMVPASSGMEGGLS